MDLLKEIMGWAKIRPRENVPFFGALNGFAGALFGDGGPRFLLACSSVSALSNAPPLPVSPNTNSQC